MQPEVKTKSFAYRVSMSSAGDILHFKITDETERLYHLFLLADEINSKLIKSKIDAASEEEIDFTKYGKVVAACYGMFPTEEVREKIKKEYNINV